MRVLSLVLACLLFSFTALAVETPSAQVRLDDSQVLRGSFMEEHYMGNAAEPMQTTGNFVAAPLYGLIWNIETPFPTSTVVTPQAAAQRFGNISVKLPIKNLASLYTTVKSALAGDWGTLEEDFVITGRNDADKWHMTLKPRPGKSNLPYANIIVTGSRFVEKIIMTKNNGQQDKVTITGATLAPTPLTAAESLAFSKIKG